MSLFKIWKPNCAAMYASSAIWTFPVHRGLPGLSRKSYLINQLVAELPHELINYIPALQTTSELCYMYIGPMSKVFITLTPNLSIFRYFWF